MSRPVFSLTAFGLALSIAGAAGAQTAPEVPDTDGNGTRSLAEMQAAYPDMTAGRFDLIDANGDGVVDADELAAAGQAGMLSR